MRRKPLLGKYRTLASWDDGSCALAQVRAGTGSALFLGTLPRYSWSNLADGHLLLPLLQRMADRGAERFSTSISLRVNDASLPQSATDTPVRLDNAQGSHPSGSPADTAGVYRLGGQTYAVNRPWPEDMPDQITDENSTSFCRKLPSVPCRVQRKPPPWCRKHGSSSCSSPSTAC